MAFLHRWFLASALLVIVTSATPLRAEEPLSAARTAEIGEIVKKADPIIDDWLSNPNVDPKLKEEYLKSGFNISEVAPKMIRELSDDLEGGANSDNDLEEGENSPAIPL